MVSIECAWTVVRRDLDSRMQARLHFRLEPWEASGDQRTAWLDEVGGSTGVWVLGAADEPDQIVQLAAQVQDIVHEALVRPRCDSNGRHPV